MEHTLNGVALAVFVFLFLLVTVIGFIAGRWRAGDLDLLDEWGLAGRRFGTWVTWFLVGGDIYTAYTFIAVPALVFGAGAIGFLRGAVYDTGLPDTLSGLSASLGGGETPRLHHAGGFRSWTFSVAAASR